MISFEKIDNYMFNIVICEFLTYDEIKLFGKNYMYSYYKPNIEWECISNYKCIEYDNYVDRIIIRSKRLNFRWVQKWKLGINEFCYLSIEWCSNKQICDFFNLNIKKFYFKSNINIVNFSKDTEEISCVGGSIVDMPLLNNLKNLKQYSIYNCKFSNYEKYYSNILFDKLILINCDIEYSINISVKINSYAILEFYFLDYFDKLKYDNLYNVKYLTLEKCDLFNFHIFFTKFFRLERLELIDCNYKYKDMFKNIVLQNINLYSVNIQNRNFNSCDVIQLNTREEILNYFN
jgi:hypothetical protein